MLKLMYGPPAQYRRNGVFIVHSQVELALMQLRSDAAAAGDKRGLFLWQPSVAAGKPNTYWGKPIYTQDDLTSTLAANADNVAIFGDVRSGYRIVDRRGMRVKRLIEKFSDQGMIGIQISRRVAGAVVRAPALRVLKMAAA
jgi:HK97 family phage major capsid protein